MNLPEENQEWRRNGNCVSLSLEKVDKLFFFGSGGSPNKAREICGPCPVRRECLHYAILHNQDGVWAGTIKEERNALKDVMLLRIIEQGLVHQDHFASADSVQRVQVLTVQEEFVEFLQELPEEYSFPIVDVAV